MSVGARSAPATAADLAALPGDARAEVIRGTIVEKASPSFEHGHAQISIGEILKGPFQRGRGGPGGWWIVTEVEVEFETHEVYRPDLSGWRRDRVPERPRGFPVHIRPDWLCEVLSVTTAANDLGPKLRTHHQAAGSLTIGSSTPSTKR